MSAVLLSVPDISCEHCERTITEALTPVEGVQAVKVDIPTKQVRVEYDGSALNVDQLKEILEEEEYPVAAAEAL